MNPFPALIASFCLIWLATTALAEPAFRIVGLDDRPALRTTVEQMAERAQEALAKNSARRWPGAADIVWTDESTFQRKTGFHPEHTFAAASVEENTIWVNEGAWTRAPEDEREKVLTHEAGHLLLGALPGGKRLPLWANEGIVMRLAGQWNWDEHFKLLMSHFVGRLPKLAELESEFPRNGEAQNLAYRVSYAAVGELENRSGGIRSLLGTLADEEHGPAFADALFDPTVRDGIQSDTQRALGSRLTTGVIVLSGSGFIFLILGVLVVVAFFRVKAKNAARAREEQNEEPWAASLTDEDVQDIYGDREERWGDGE
ncbi:hypothetical protein BH09SUM1_BH09SUM1_16340 [soil metagenome]